MTQGSRERSRHQPVSLAGASVTTLTPDQLRAAVERQPARVERPGHVPAGVKVAARLNHGQVSADAMMTYPYSSIGRIMAAPIGSSDFQGVCTGVLVGPNMVLSATHLLRDRPLSEWTFKFLPGYHDGEREEAPDGHSRGASLFTGQVVHGNATGSVNGSGPTEIVNGFDFSIFQLVHRLGDHWGHLGTISANGSSFYEDRSWQSVGYPVVLSGGRFPRRTTTAHARSRRSRSSAAASSARASIGTAGRAARCSRTTTAPGGSAASCRDGISTVPSTPTGCTCSAGVRGWPC